MAQQMIPVWWRRTCPRTCNNSLISHVFISPLTSLMDFRVVSVCLDQWRPACKPSTGWGKAWWSLACNLSPEPTHTKPRMTIRENIHWLTKVEALHSILQTPNSHCFFSPIQIPSVLNVTLTSLSMCHCVFTWNWQKAINLIDFCIATDIIVCT